VIQQDAVAWAAQVEQATSAKVHLLRPGESYTVE